MIATFIYTGRCVPGDGVCLVASSPPLFARLPCTHTGAVYTRIATTRLYGEESGRATPGVYYAARDTSRRVKFAQTNRR